ncbi:39S ribosomal protein L30, mitochondrial [Asbolus verrucosus]|uniref:Large ribosomal subunit protein uL30m n=1 Tax=Asbolus verrucosus TaxID=1661398 RepID=A0A482VTE9_ASBVE|nr:39S ribosomal protein L30, mitochondrial [Asbolus verrucosus]
MSKLLKPWNFLLTAQRTMAVRRYNWNNEGIQYPGFKYYPRYNFRYPDFKDPPYEPSKLFRVQRIKPLKGVPYYEKKILEEFKLDGKSSEVVIIKNIPENNQRLWKVKHLIKICPITFPDGFPTDTRGTYLKENGELCVMKTLESPDEKLKLTDEFRTKPDRMDGDTLRRDSRKKWLNGW